MIRRGPTNVHPSEKHFFDIPVLRCDFAAWGSERDDRKKMWAQLFTPKGQAVDDWALEAADRQVRSEWSAYRYSELVGMIRLFAINLQIRAELWFVKERVSRSLKRKTWHLANPKLFEYWTHEGMLNEHIYRDILGRIKEENTKWILKNRYIDLEAFENSGKCIDYLTLTNCNLTDAEIEERRNKLLQNLLSKEQGYRESGDTT